jgi:hypothetical protein
MQTTFERRQASAIALIDERRRQTKQDYFVTAAVLAIAGLVAMLLF